MHHEAGLALSTKEIPFKPERKHIIGFEGWLPLALAIAIGGAGGHCMESWKFSRDFSVIIFVRGWRSRA